jgi:hypothetical protein
VVDASCITSALGDALQPLGVAVESLLDTRGIGSDPQPHHYRHLVSFGPVLAAIRSGPAGPVKPRHGVLTPRRAAVPCEDVSLGRRRGSAFDREFVERRTAVPMIINGH